MPGPHWAASEGPIATAMNEKPKAVFSRTLENAEWGPVEIFGGDLSTEIATLTSLGLVDEYQLTTVPIAIGAGHSPFAELREHLSSTSWKRSAPDAALAQILVPKQ